MDGLPEITPEISGSYLTKIMIRMASNCKQGQGKKKSGNPHIWITASAC